MNSALNLQLAVARGASLEHRARSVRPPLRRSRRGARVVAPAASDPSPPAASSAGGEGRGGGRAAPVEPRFRAGARAALPFAAAAATFGASFGILAVSAGMGPVAPVVMSATAFAGSAQFAVVSTLAAGGGVAAAVAAAVLLNARYLPMSLSVAPALTGSRRRRVAESQLVVDESWALANQGGGRFDRGVLLGAGAVLYAGWVGGTVAGVAVGDVFGDPEQFGLDAAFPALFLGLLASQLHGGRALAVAGAGAAIALALTPLAPAGVPIVAASAATLVGWRRS